MIEAVGVDEESQHSLERVQGSLVLRLREEVIPVVDLQEVLELEFEGSATPSSEVGSLVIVMRVNSRAFGVVVDRVVDVQEIVVKPLGASLTHLKVFSGHTILGDGSVVLILDPTGIASHLGFERSNDYSGGHVSEVFEPAETNTRFVLFRAGAGVPKGLPLSLIARIEIGRRFGHPPVGRHLCDAAPGSADAARAALSDRPGEHAIGQPRACAWHRRREHGPAR